jgi:hypothetical protein
MVCHRCSVRRPRHPGAAAIQIPQFWTPARPGMTALSAGDYGCMSGLFAS